MLHAEANDVCLASDARLDGLTLCDRMGTEIIEAHRCISVMTFQLIADLTLKNSHIMTLCLPLHRTDVARDVDNALGNVQFRGESPEILMIFSFALKVRVRFTKSMKVS